MLVISFSILALLALFSFVQPLLDIGWGKWVILPLLVSVTGYGSYVLIVYSPHHQITVRSISDRTCYKCHKTVMDATTYDIAIKNAEERLEIHRQSIHEVNSLWKPGDKRS